MRTRKSWRQKLADNKGLLAKVAWREVDRAQVGGMGASNTAAVSRTGIVPMVPRRPVVS